MSVFVFDSVWRATWSGVSGDVWVVCMCLLFDRDVRRGVFSSCVCVGVVFLCCFVVSHGVMTSPPPPHTTRHDACVFFLSFAFCDFISDLCECATVSFVL